ncbi:MAG: hypothetical protein Q9192_006990 [Flavoplaca navasiana]
MFAPFEYLLTIALITFYYLLSITAIPLAILCTTVGLFGDWPERISFLKNPAWLRERSSSATTSTTPDTNDTTTNADTMPSSPSNTPNSHEKDGPPPNSSSPTPNPSAAPPSWSTPSRVRGAAFALALLRLWFSGEIRALSQFMFTVNLLILVGYGGLWVWVIYGVERGLVG